MSEPERFDEWALVEMMGHRKIGGRVTEATLAGGAFLRIDIPGPKGNVATQYISPSSVYAITPVTEETARRFAAGCVVQPASRWELRELPAEVDRDDTDDDGPYVDDDGRPSF